MRELRIINYELPKPAAWLLDAPDVVTLPDADAQVLEIKVEDKPVLSKRLLALASAVGQNLESSEYRGERSQASRKPTRENIRKTGV